VENSQVLGSFELEALLKSIIGISDEFKNMVIDSIEKLEAGGYRGNLKASLFPEDTDSIIPF